MENKQYQQLQDEIRWLERRFVQQRSTAGLIIASYTTATAQNITSGGSAQIINYDTKIKDNWNCVTVGASWQFLVPNGGKRDLFVYARNTLASSSAWAEDESAQLDVYRNGSIHRGLDLKIFEAVTTAKFTVLKGGSLVEDCMPGDTINVRLYQNSGSTIALHNNANQNYVIIIEVLSGLGYMNLI